MDTFIISKDGLAFKRTRDDSVKDHSENLLLADKKFKVEPRDVIQSNKTKANDETKEDNTAVWLRYYGRLFCIYVLVWLHFKNIFLIFYYLWDFRDSVIHLHNE